MSKYDKYILYLISLFDRKNPFLSVPENQLNKDRFLKINNFYYDKYCGVLHFNNRNF
jgi:hypothetical protein